MESIICPSCGASNPLEASVCENCNEDLSTVKSVIDTANNHYNEALALAHNGRLDEAISQLEAALALNAQNPQYYNLLGTMYAQKGLYSEAIDAWERSLSLNPEAEKAYHNIEKAHDMEEETAETQRKRPFLITSIAACIAAAFLLLTTGYFGVRSYFKTQSINTLNQQLNEQKSELQDWKNKYTNMQELLPEEGINGLANKITELQTLANARQEQLERTTKQLNSNLQQRNDEIENLKEQLNTLREENRELERQNQNINQLQAIINNNNQKIQSLEDTISQKDEQIEDAKQLAEEYRIRMATAQTEIENIKQEKENAIENQRATHDKIVSGLRSEILELRDEIAQYERRLEDMKYANGLVTEAYKNLGKNNFSLAMSNVENAIERAPNHQLAIFLHNEVQKILNDPLEQEIRRREADEREIRRQEQKEELLKKNLDLAKKHYNEGEYNKTVELVNRSLVLMTADHKLYDDYLELKEKSVEMNKQIALMLLEAKTEMQEGNVKKAESVLNQILKRAPANVEAREMKSQLIQ